MNTFALCIVLAMFAQAWDAPRIQEAELDAPTGRAATPSRPATESWDMDSDDRAAEKSAPAEQEADKREVRWVYDDNGQPVAQPVEAPRAVEKVEPSENKQPEPERTSRTQSTDGRTVATFWFVLPKR